MCDICRAKAQRISELAGFFLEKADETGLPYYIQRMNEVALSLEELAKYFSTGCRCGEDQDRYMESVLAATEHRLSETWTAQPRDRNAAA